MIRDEVESEFRRLLLLGRLGLAIRHPGKRRCQCRIQERLIAKSDFSARFLGDELVEEKHLLT